MTTKTKGRLLEGMEALELALDPNLAALKREHDEREGKRLAVQPRKGERKTGGRGQPQCSGCRAPLPVGAQACPQCGFVEGAGYLGVPAKVSYLERHR